MKTSFTFLLLAIVFALSAQKPEPKNNTLSKKDAMRLAKLNAKGVYPLIKASKFSGVLPVDGITEKPDTNMTYKLLISLTNGTRDADKVKELNRGLAEAGRILNLHIAAGIPKQNIDMVIVTHSLALFTLLNNGAFNKEFKSDNPNMAIIKELEDAGAKFVACGQAMQFLEIDKASLLPTIKIALAAKVAISSYAQKGYALFEIGEE